MEDARETIRRFRKQEADANRYYYRNVVSTDDAEGTRGERHLVERRHAANVIERAEAARKRAVRTKSALQRSDRNTPFATATLRLIIRNGKNREKSICAIMQKMLHTRPHGKSTTATGRS